MIKNKNIFLGKKILIYGLGKSGVSSYKFLKNKADKAISISKSSRGVKKVVPLFEIDNAYKSKAVNKNKNNEEIN